MTGKWRAVDVSEAAENADRAAVNGGGTARESLFSAQGFWDEVTDVDAWLDDAVGGKYEREPLAQTWARVAKITEEAGEAIAELILTTGQNPRKGIDPAARERMLEELADAALTGILAIQHFTKDSEKTCGLIERRMTRIWNRMSAS